MTFKSLDGKKMIIGTLILAAVVIGIFALLLNRFGQQTDSGVEISGTAVSELAYCSEEQVKPCVVSFGLDADNNMLVNILLPDQDYPDFYLQVMRGDVTVSYECQRIAAAPGNVYCIGEKLPPGESLRLMLISSADDVILAEGILSIIGLAFPTLEITTPTDSPTARPAYPPPTEASASITATPTPTSIQLQTRTPAPTKPSYPNTSYP
ncbi:MAG: hypothetical protein R3307_06325 [Anaerolineales bacterium]|nr:hypothetical protein [Anaerolineales bacterium]